MGYTDSNGKVNIRLRVTTGSTPSVIYSITAEREGEILTTYSNQMIDSTSVTLQAIIVSYYDWFARRAHLSYECGMVTGTNILRCQITDVITSGTTFNLKVYKRSVLRTYIINDATTGTPCDVTTSSLNTYMTCDMGTLSNDTYYYYLYVTYPPTSFSLETTDLIDSQVLDLSSKQNYGVMGLFAAFMIITTVFFLFGSYNPTLALMMSVVGLIACSVLKLISIETTAMTGLICVAAFIIFKLRS